MTVNERYCGARVKIGNPETTDLLSTYKLENGTSDVRGVHVPCTVASKKVGGSLAPVHKCTIFESFMGVHLLTYLRKV